MSETDGTASKITSVDRSFGALDPIKQQALEWVDRLVSDETTDRDADAVRRWCKLSPAHASAFAEVVHLWRALGLVADVFANEARTTPGERPSSSA